jgi:hypothetical protein
MSLLNKVVLEGLSEIVKATIIICGELYNFDANEAMAKISIDSVLTSETLKSSSEVRKDVRESEKVEKKVKKAEKSEKSEKSEIPMPYNGEYNPECCNGLKHNQGLYTQCKIKRKGSEKYCKMCDAQASKHSHGKPTYGTIQDRQAVGIMDFVDPSGKKPEMYMKILSKMNITVDEVQEEAKKQNIEINEVHFEEEQEKVVSEKTTEKSKGRPKKSKKLLEVANDEDEDLITTLLAKSKQAKDSETTVNVNEEAEKQQKEAAEKQQKEASKKQKKAAAEKQQKEAVEKQQKEAAEKQQKEAAEKQQKEAAEKQQKEAAEKQKKDQETGTKVKRFSYTDGKTYLRSLSTGIVYSTDSVEVGKWNETTNEIDFEDDNEEIEDAELEEEPYLEGLNKDEEEEEEDDE